MSVIYLARPLYFKWPLKQAGRTCTLYTGFFHRTYVAVRMPYIIIIKTVIFSTYMKVDLCEPSKKPCMNLSANRGVLMMQQRSGNAYSMIAMQPRFVHGDMTTLDDAVCLFGSLPVKQHDFAGSSMGTQLYVKGELRPRLLPNYN